MPKIERSVAYTFDAYSGGLKNEALGMIEEDFKRALKKLQYFKVFDSLKGFKSFSHKRKRKLSF